MRPSKKLINRDQAQSFEDLNVLPDLFDRFVACGLSLSRFRLPTDHQKHKEEHDAESACDVEIKHSESPSVISCRVFPSSVGF